jgi:hypothetical protein
VVQGIFTICVSVFNSTGNYPNFCTWDAVPLDVWVQVTYTYDRTRTGYDRTRTGYVMMTVTYVNSTGTTTVLSTGQWCGQVNGNYDLYNMDMLEFTPLKFVLTYSAVTDCSDNKFDSDPRIRPLDYLGKTCFKRISMTTIE